MAMQHPAAHTNSTSQDKKMISTRWIQQRWGLKKKKNNKYKHRQCSHEIEQSSSLIHGACSQSQRLSAKAPKMALQLEALENNFAFIARGDELTRERPADKVKQKEHQDIQHGANRVDNRVMR
jgi:hypothetical protein